MYLLTLTRDGKWNAKNIAEGWCFETKAEAIQKYFDITHGKKMKLEFAIFECKFIEVIDICTDCPTNSGIDLT